MNISSFMRFVNRSSKLYATKHHARVLPVMAVQSKSMSASTNVSVSPSKELESFQDMLPSIIDSLSASKRFAEVPEVASWIKKILEYNLAGGKKNRGMTTVMSYEMLEKPDNITEETLRLARTLGWCVEMLQAYFLVADDIMDGSSTRRGVPCWYTLPDVGLGAVNDAILIYTSMFEVLRNNFGHLPQYSHILNLFNETVLLTSVGQHLDYTMAHRNKNDYSMFTIEKYETIVKHKTAYYTYRLPLTLGMLLANVTDKQIMKKTEDICLEFGILFQMQDDYIDCYSEESVSGKKGTDIQEGKCSWLAVTALQHFPPVQRAMFQQFYGSPDKGHVQKIKWLYDMAKLPQIYKAEETARYENILNKIDDLAIDSPASRNLFLKMIEMIYHRKQ